MQDKWKNYTLSCKVSCKICSRFLILSSLGLAPKLYVPLPLLKAMNYWNEASFINNLKLFDVISSEILMIYLFFLYLVWPVCCGHGWQIGVQFERSLEVVSGIPPVVLFVPHSAERYHTNTKPDFVFQV